MFSSSYIYTGNDTVYSDSITYLWNLDDTTVSTLQTPTHSYGPGNYEVCLQITYQALGTTCIKTFCDSVRVGSVCDSLTPISYTYTNTGTSYSFTSTSITYTGIGSLDTDSIIYYWDFDDGNSSGTQNPSNIFGSGDYIVCLQNIYNAPGEVCSQSYCDTIKLPSICDSIIASFSSSLSGANAIAFHPSYTGSTTADTNFMFYSWNFGDGNTSTQKYPNHIYSPGTYLVCMDFTYQEVGTTCTQSICDTITIVEVCDSLTSSFNANHTSLNTYSFNPSYTYSGSSFIDTTLMSYHWDFGDGDSSVLKYPNHTYSTGTHIVCMEFTYTAPGDTCIKTMCDTLIIYSVCDSVTTSFTSTVTALNTRLFTSSYSYGGTGVLDTNLIELTWNFGDGSIPTNQKEPTHTFPTGGIYTVCLQFSYQTPGNVCVKTICDTITIASICDSITTSFSPSYQSPNTFSFTPFINYTGPGILDSNNSNYSWSFGDGTTSGQEFPIHTFTPGIHVICLQYNYQLSGVTCLQTFCDTLSTTVIASINELTNKDIRIYPNPATNNLTVFIENINFINNESILKLIDISGKEVYTGKLTQQKEILDVTPFDKGYYVLVIDNNIVNTVRKIIIE
jgi:PKD repeat protein